MAVKEKIRIRLQSYDAQLIDAAAEKIVETAKHTGARVSGPIPLPTDREIVTVLRATHKYKDSRLTSAHICRYSTPYDKNLTSMNRHPP